MLLLYLYLSDEQESSLSPPSAKRQRRSLSKAPERILPRQCIFHLASTNKLCGKTGQRYIRNKRTGIRQEEKVVQCLTLEAEQRLKSAALQRNDQNLLILALRIGSEHDCFLLFSVVFRDLTGYVSPASMTAI